MSDLAEPIKRLAPSSYVPAIFRADGPYGDIIKKVDSFFQGVMDFLRHNLNWLREPGGIKTLLIKLPDAIVSISKRIGPATRIPGKIINVAAEILMPIHKLGGCASSLLGFAEVATKFPAMFEPFKERVQYVVRDDNGKVVRDKQGKACRAHFDLNYLEQTANKAASVADWTLSFTGCFSYIWRLNHNVDEKFPLASLATWSARYMSIQCIYSESLFFYETWGTQKSDGERKSGESGIRGVSSEVLQENISGSLPKSPERNASFGETPPETASSEFLTPQRKRYVPIQNWNSEQSKYVAVDNAIVAWEEVAGSVLRIFPSVVCLSLDMFKVLAARGNSSPWLDTAIFCAGLAPTFITPVAMRYWPKMVVEPLHAAASA